MKLHITNKHYFIAGCILMGFSASVLADEGVRTNTAVPSYTNNSDYKVGFGFDRGFSVVGQLYNKVNLSLGDDGVAADYIFLTGKFNQKLPFTWYASVGGFYDWDNTCHNGCGNPHHDSDHYFNDYGVRVPFGLDWNFASRWDTYVQLAPVINVPDDFDVEFQAAIGIRYSL
ncbi:hypothetical protein [Vibrio litoralis]|uniref:hypothetical protein n=1 Tax=Vibrio litoralis TaxID=335972 RepID=UPI001866C7EB|nr:hypothetical protein [Vibrio litoralis]